MASYTPNYNLKKPADTDSYDIADANGNMDLIDTALHSQNEAITTYNIGSNTLANLETALATFGSSLSNREIRPIVMNPSAASGLFNATSYYGTIRRDSNGRYNVTLQGMQSPEQVVYGNYMNGAWTWSSTFDRFKQFKVEAYGTNIFANTSVDVPVTVEPNSWKVYWIIAGYGNTNEMWQVVVSQDAVKSSVKVFGNGVLSFQRPNSSSLRITSTVRINVTIMDVGLS